MLIRALEPVEGTEVMRTRRGRDELTNGPARLTEALGIGPEHQRHVLREPPVWIGAGDSVADEQVVNTSRVGISKAADWELRYYVKESAWVSRR